MPKHTIRKKGLIMIIEGKNPCYEALISDLTIEKVLFSKLAPSDYVNKLKPLIKQKNTPIGKISVRGIVFYAN